MNNFKLKIVHQFWSFAKGFDQKCYDAKRKSFEAGQKKVLHSTYACSIKTLTLCLDHYRNGEEVEQSGGFCF